VSRRKRRFATAHTHDRARHLNRLITESGGRCRWCNCEIVRVRQIKRMHEVLGENKVEITWLEDGKRRTAAVATVDHVVSLARGGSREPANLVASCARCNFKRNAADFPPKPRRSHRERWQDRHPIPEDDRELGDPGA
jgi:hypothetical protein